MEEEARKQFTFYESFSKALRRIKKAADRAAAYDAICDYALYGQEPDLDKLPGPAAIAFELIRPTLDASRRKARSGKKGGSKSDSSGKQTESNVEANGKQTESKSEANCNREQTASEKENEIENEKENEIEIEDECLERKPAELAKESDLSFSLPGTSEAAFPWDDSKYRQMVRIYRDHGWSLSPALERWAREHPEEMQTIDH